MALSRAYALLAATLALAVCTCNRPTGEDPAPADVTVTPPAPAADGRAPATPAAPRPAAPVDATPEDAVRRRVPDAGLLWAMAWPGAGADADVVVALVDLPHAGSRDRDRGLIWVHRREAALPLDRAPYAFPGAEVASGAALDVNGDGGPELVLFLRAGAGETSNSVAVFSLHLARRRIDYLGRESAALDGARSVEAARARLPLTLALTPEQAGALSTSALTARISYATPEQFRLMAAPTMQRCDSLRQGLRDRRTCRSFRTRRIDAPAFEREVRAPIEQALSIESLLGWSCDEAPTPRCTAQRAGGTSWEFVYEGAGAERRLRRVELRDRNLGE